MQNGEYIQVAVSHCKKALKHVFLFSAAINILNMFMPLYTLQVLDRVASTGNMSTLFLLTFITVSALTVMTMVEGARRFLLTRVGEWLEKELSNALILGGFMLNAANFKCSGAQVMRDLGVIKGFIAGNSCSSIFDAPWAILFFVCVWIINPATAVVTLIGVVALVLFAILSEKATTPLLKRVNEGHYRNLQDLDIASRNAETIEIMGMSSKVTSSWLMRHEIISRMNGLVSSRSNLIALALKYVRMLLQVAIYCAGIVYSLKTGGTIGGVIACSILIGRVLAPFESFVSSWRGIVSARVSYARLMSMQGYHNAIVGKAVDPNEVELPTPRGSIRGDKLVVLYPNTKNIILKGISFNFNAGECIAITGPNGAGKTTLLRVALGLLIPVSGLATIDNIESHKWNREHLGSYIGFVGQDVEFFEATVRDNIARMDRYCSMDLAVEAARTAGVHDLILSLPRGYDTIIGGNNGLTLTSGQKQQLALARAIFGNVRILVLDEPNANLDRDAEQRLISTIKWAKEKGVTVIFTTHKVQLLQIADRMVVMQNGMIVSDGKRDEVVTTMQKMADAR